MGDHALIVSIGGGRTNKGLRLLIKIGNVSSQIATMLQGIRSAARPYGFLTVLLACVFTLANYYHLRCTFEEPGAALRSHS